VHLGRLFQSRMLFALALATVLASALAQQYLGTNKKESYRNMDFYVYYFASQMVHDNPHADLYAGATTRNTEGLRAKAGSEIDKRAKAAGMGGSMSYLYPPLLADILAPISQFAPNLATLVWRVFNLALVFLSVLLLARMFRVPLLSFEFAALALAAYSFFPVNEAIFNGQVTVVMLALWTVGIVAYSENRIILSAAALALATAFKITPILIVPLFFVWKDRRWLVSYFAVSLVIVLAMVGFNGLHNVTAYPGVLSAMSSGVPAEDNKTLSSLANWVYYGRVFHFDASMTATQPQQHGLLIVAKAISGAFYLLCLYLVWRVRQIGQSSRVETIAAFALIIACTSPVSWRHAYTAVFITLAIFWVRALRSSPRTPHTVLLALTSITVGSVFFDVAADGPLPQLCKVLLAGSEIVVSVLFCIDTLYHIKADAAAPWPRSTENGLPV